MADDPAPAAWAEPYQATAEAVVRLFYPHVAAAIHDIERNVLVRAWNPLSPVRPGDPSRLDADLLGELADHGVAGPYAEAGPHGEELSSVSALIGGGRGLLCLSFDRSVVSSAVAALSGFARGVETRPAGPSGRDRPDELNGLVYQWCQERDLRPARLSREDRRDLVAYLDGRGAFQVRRAASHLAAILGVSRATVYAALQSAR